MISREEANRQEARWTLGILRSLQEAGSPLAEALDMAIEALSQPERPKGRWEFVELKDHPLYGKPLKVGEYRCPFCGRAVAFKPPYCHCGADMRGEEE